MQSPEERMDERRRECYLEDFFELIKKVRRVRLGLPDEHEQKKYLAEVEENLNKAFCNILIDRER